MIAVTMYMQMRAKEQMDEKGEATKLAKQTLHPGKGRGRKR